MLGGKAPRDGREMWRLLREMEQDLRRRIEGAREYAKRVGGGAQGGAPDLDPYQPNAIPWANRDMTGNISLAADDLYMLWRINCTSAANLTLPPMSYTDWVRIHNVGTQTITVKDEGANTVTTLASSSAEYEVRGTELTDASPDEPEV